MTPLAGRCIVLTRPAQQSAALAAAIRDAGGEALVFPALAIEPLDDVALAARIAQLDAYDGAIFISPNAAQLGLTAVRARREWPVRLATYALGPGTARALVAAGVAGVVQPDGQDSEALLALPALQHVTGQAWLIFRGAGGRELLADTLRARGAQVEYAECYRRVSPATDAAPLLMRWSAGDVDAVVISSAETLHNLLVLLGESGAASLRATPVFAPHEKIAAAVRAAGVQRVIATAGGDDGIFAGLVNWFDT